MRVRYLFMFLAICFLIMGCSRKADIAGKVIDWKGQPLSGVKVIAKPLYSTKDQEHLQAITNAEGMFHFDKVSPKSGYALSVFTDQWRNEQKILIQSGAEEMTNKVPFTIVIRFTISPDSVITDTKTGMQWVPVPDYTFSWDGAITFAQNLKAGGYSDWSLPSRAELRKLYDGSLRNEITATFHIGTNTWVWSSEPHDSSTIWRFNLLTGVEDFIFRGNSMGNMAIVAMHSPK